jgi:protein MpaA
MNIKRITSILILLIITFTTADAGSWKKTNAILRKAVKSYRSLPSSGIKWKVLGKSNWKNRIYYKEFGSGKKLTLIIGGIHGDEPASTIAPIRLAQYIKKNYSLISNRVIIIPCLNPDGLIKGRRTNGRKVDINRNFPTKSWSPEFIKEYNNPGRLPASEPETVLLANAIDDFRPDLIIQMHQPFNTIYPDDKTPAKLVEKMSEITGLPISEDIGYPTPGSLGSFKSSLEYEVQGITFELCEIDREPEYDKITEALIEAINY